MEQALITFLVFVLVGAAMVSFIDIKSKLWPYGCFLFSISLAGLVATLLNIFYGLRT